MRFIGQSTISAKTPIQGGENTAFEFHYSIAILMLKPPPPPAKTLIKLDGVSLKGTETSTTVY